MLAKQFCWKRISIAIIILENHLSTLRNSLIKGNADRCKDQLLDQKLNRLKAILGCQLKLLSQSAVETKLILIISKDLSCVASKRQSINFLALVQFDILALAVLDSIDKS